MPAISVPLLPRARQGGYLSKTCREKISKDNQPNHYPEELKTPTSMFLQDLFDGGNDFEDRIGQLLAEKVPAGEFANIPEVRGPDGERTKAGKREKEAASFAAYLDPAVRIIFNPRIGPHFEELLSAHLGSKVEDTDRISEPDLIELGDYMPNGLRAMRFIDVKWHKMTSGKTKNPKTFDFSELDQPYRDAVIGTQDFYGTLHNEDWRQLAHYYRHGQTLGLVKSVLDGGAWAGVIGKEEIVVWANLDTLSFQMNRDGKRQMVSPLAIYDADYHDALKVVDNARERNVDISVEPIAFPEWKGDCGMCPWLDVCKGELKAFGDGGHVTLLPGITPDRAIPLYDQKIRDTRTLALQDPMCDEAETKVKTDWIWTARVAYEGTTAYLNASTEQLDMPRADIEIDFDCESESTVYMWGVRVHDTTTGVVTEHMFDDYSRDEEGELRVFTEVWALFQSLIVAAEAADKSVRLYHYSPYERTQMKLLAERYVGLDGVPTVDDVLALYIDSGAVVDLLEVLKTQIVFPTESFSIKKLAVFAGFRWRDETPGGDMSMVWYRAACSDPDPLVREENKARLREYNLDDVAAQAHLRNWAVTADLTTVTALPAPTLEKVAA